MQTSITPTGDSAITVTFGNRIDEKINQQVFFFFNTLKKKNIDGVKDIIPAYASVTVVYDILKTRKANNVSAFQHMRDRIERVLQEPGLEPELPGRKLNVPVCYHVSLGVDLIHLSGQKQLEIEDIVRIHSSATYRVYMLGFLPGFAYMGTVNEKIAAPRKATPANVRGGSVGIADAQTGIYPFDSPGGWNIVGQTPLSLFDKHSERPCFFQPGDEVKFEPISLEKFFQLKSS